MSGGRTGYPADPRRCDQPRRRVAGWRCAFHWGHDSAFMVRIMADDAYARRVHRVMDHVRRNLADDLSLEELAKVAFFSPHHFHRVFKAHAGETLAAFTRRARLERAVYLMKASPERALSSVAMDAGFSSPSDFSRAFRRQFGKPPTAWDRKSRLDDSDVEARSVEQRIAAQSAPDFEVAVRERPTCRMLYARARKPFVTDSVQRAFGRLVEWLDTQGVGWRTLPLLGLSWDNYETTPLEQVRFDIGFAVGSELVAPDSLGVHDFPGMLSAEVHCNGPLSHVAHAWDHLYETWLPGSRYEPDDYPAFKRFRTHPDLGDWSVWDLDCSLPIRPLRG